MIVLIVHVRAAAVLRARSATKAEVAAEAMAMPRPKPARDQQDERRASGKEGRSDACQHEAEDDLAVRPWRR